MCERITEFGTSLSGNYLLMKQLNNILIIDDDPIVTFLNEALLNEEGIAKKITIAHDGKEALQILNHYCHYKKEECLPQLILLDLNMPVMDGFDFLEAYQYLDFEEKDSIVVVITTSSLNPSDLKRISKYRTDEYIVKPLTKEKITHLMEKYFSREEKQ